MKQTGSDEAGSTKDLDERSREGAAGPLDGSTSGTIGGGGPQTGGPTQRPAAAEMPPANPGNAASGRKGPDAVDAANPPDPLTSIG